MKAFPILFALFFSLLSCVQDSSQEEITTTYFFVRHAEKDISDPSNRNPALTEEGKNRAQNWSRILSDTKVDMVFTTDYDRTRQTAMPIAKSQGLALTVYDPRDLYNTDFQQKTKGKTCVIVGHSNTTPAFVNKIIGKRKYIDIDEKVYGKLFVIKIKGDVVTDIVLNIN